MRIARDERARVRGAQRGSVSDLEALYRTHWPRAYRAAYLVTHDAAAAEDIAQESFLAAIRALDTFDRRRPFGPWLHRIVVNRAIDWTRARRLRAEVELSESVPASPERPRAPRDDVVAALARLAPEHRAVVVMRYLLEFTPGEIAEALGLPRGTVNSRLRRGLDALEGGAVRDELQRVEIPGEADAFERGWPVLEAAFAERQPAPRPSHWPRVAAVALAVAAVLGAAFTSPGQAVLDEIREVVGVERAEQALFELPAPGKLLVSSDSGVWVVQEDGSRRRLGDYREASWSPFGRFVVAARANELAALELDGDVRWSLAREGVSSPRWAGTETDTRIAYVDSTGLRVVAGDGTGDRLLVRGFRGAIAWRPGDGFELAVADGREVRLLDTTDGKTVWRRARGGTSRPRCTWSSDGRRLLVAGGRSVVVFDERGAVPYELGPGAAPVTVRGARAARAKPRVRAGGRPANPALGGSADPARRGRRSPALLRLGPVRAGRVVAGRELGDRRLGRRRPVGLRPRERRRDPSRVEHLAAVPVAGVPAGRGLVLHVGSAVCSAPATPSPTSRSGRPRARRRARSRRCSARASRS